MPKATKSQHIKVFPSVSHTTFVCPSDGSETTALLHVDTDTPRGISHPKVGVNPPTLPWSCHCCPLVAFKWWCFFDCIIDRAPGQSQEEGPSMWETVHWECANSFPVSNSLSQPGSPFLPCPSYTAIYPFDLVRAWPMHLKAFYKLHI